MRSMIAAMAHAPNPRDWAGVDEFFVGVLDRDGTCVDNATWGKAEAACAAVRGFIAAYGRQPGEWTVQLQADYDIVWSWTVGREL